MLQLLETALVDGVNKVPEAMEPSSVSSLTNMLSLVADNSGSIEFDDRTKSSLQGINFSLSISFCCSILWKGILLISL